MEQVNLRATIAEPVRCNYGSPELRNKRSHCNEKPVHSKQERSSLTTTRESLGA